MDPGHWSRTVSNVQVDEAAELLIRLALDWRPRIYVQISRRISRENRQAGVEWNSALRPDDLAGITRVLVGHRQGHVRLDQHVTQPEIANAFLTLRLRRNECFDRRDAVAVLPVGHDDNRLSADGQSGAR